MIFKISAYSLLSNWFLEAEMAKNRITELKAQDFGRRREELLMNQAKEREEVEQAHILEYQEFNKNWDDVMSKTAEEHDQMIKILEEKHIRELEENRAKLDQTLPGQPKASAELLNNKKIQE